MEQTRQRCLALKRHLDSIRHDKDQMLRQIHHMFQLSHGSFFEELPEQIMSILFIKPHSKVLEIGGNIGRPRLSDTDEAGWIEVAIKDYIGLRKAHPIEFDTLVLDYEGAFYIFEFYSNGKEICHLETQERKLQN